jgi:hypothetical protein
MYESLGKAGTAPDQGAIDVLEAQIAGLREAVDLLRHQIDDVRACRERNRISGLRSASRGHPGASLAVSPRP